MPYGQTTDLWIYQSGMQSMTSKGRHGLSDPELPLNRRETALPPFTLINAAAEVFLLTDYRWPIKNVPLMFLLCKHTTSPFSRLVYKLPCGHPLPSY